MQKEIHDRPRCIVLPLQDSDSPGMGLALHFLLGNVIAANISFRECWFGWRVASIFPEPDGLKQYCQGGMGEFDLQAISEAQDVQCWLHGRVNNGTAVLHVFNARSDTFDTPEKCAITPTDHLVGFRQCALNLLSNCGYPISRQRQAMALWPENIGPDGLRLVGRALDVFYTYSAYGVEETIQLDPFEAAVKAAPESFMAHNLLGWAHYRRQNAAQAKTSFLRALVLSPDAIGPMAGLAGCAVLENDRESALYWAARKAQTHADDVAAAVEKTRKKFQP